jgi:hypothetical protein
MVFPGELASPSFDQGMPEIDQQQSGALVRKPVGGGIFKDVSSG